MVAWLAPVPIATAVIAAWLWNSLWSDREGIPFFAAMALFLCSPRAGHIQGTAIAVDGGATGAYY